METSYQPLLNVQLWHDYYLGQPRHPQSLPSNYDISDVLMLVPTADCLRSLQNLRWIVRPQPQGMTILSEVEAIASDQPNTHYRTKIKVDQPYQLTFYLIVRDPTFANFTNLPFTGNRHQIFYFSNRSGNDQTYTFNHEAADPETVSYLFLSQPLSPYTPGQEYPLGQLVTYGDHTLEALQHLAIAEASPSAEVWATLPSTQYVSTQDRVPLQGSTYPYRIAAADPEDRFSFTLIDISGNSVFEKTITVPKTHAFGDPVALSLNFAGQSPGRYRLVLNETPIDEFVLCNLRLAPQCFALVDITVDPAMTTPFSFLQTSADGTFIQPRTYIIRFKNRSTCWRYRTQKAHGLTEAELAPQGFTRVDQYTFVTTHPRGLLKFPDFLPLNNSQRNLPFPNTTQVKPIKNGNQHVTQVFSDIYL